MGCSPSAQRELWSAIRFGWVRSDHFDDAAAPKPLPHSLASEEQIDIPIDSAIGNLTRNTREWYHPLSLRSLALPKDIYKTSSKQHREASRHPAMESKA